MIQIRTVFNGPHPAHGVVEQPPRAKIMLADVGRAAATEQHRIEFSRVRLQPVGFLGTLVESNLYPIQTILVAEEPEWINQDVEAGDTTNAEQDQGKQRTQIGSSIVQRPAAAGGSAGQITKRVHQVLGRAKARPTRNWPTSRQTPDAYRAAATAGTLGKYARGSTYLADQAAPGRPSRVRYEQHRHGRWPAPARDGSARPASAPRACASPVPDAPPRSAD